MITVRIPLDYNFDFDECSKLYRKYQNDIQDDATFNEVIVNTYFYSFYDDDQLLGCIYLFYKNGLLFLNAFAERGHHLKNLECFNKIFDWFDCDIYAYAMNKMSVMCLLRSGFKKIKDNLYIKEK